MAQPEVTTAAASPRDMRTFAIIWLGQLVSLCGSGLTSFALGVYVFEQNNSTTQLVLIWLFVALPRILVSPLAGALIDRWDRRWAMILGDAGAALGTLFITLMFFTGRLAVWHIYLSTLVSASFSTFQWPAYAASMTLLVPKEQLGRANGLTELSQGFADIATPLAAGVLITALGLGGVILIDVATFLFAVGTLLLVRFPRPEASAKGQARQGSLLREMTLGWTTITARPGLVGLLALSASAMVLGGTTEVLLTPLVLSFASADALGLVLSIGGIGVLIGGLVMSAWGGPKRLISGVVGFEIAAGVATLLAGLWPSVPLISAAVFLLFFTYPILTGCEMPIWQRKIAPDLQGRVFAARRVVLWLPLPLVILGGGPLVDGVMEPAMAAGGALASSAGRVIGTGPGRGIGLAFVICGGLNVLAAIGAYLHPRIRHVEDELPDVIDDEPETRHS